MTSTPPDPNPSNPAHKKPDTSDPNLNPRLKLRVDQFFSIDPADIELTKLTKLSAAFFRFLVYVAPETDPDSEHYQLLFLAFFGGAHLATLNAPVPDPDMRYEIRSIRSELAKQIATENN